MRAHLPDPVTRRPAGLALARLAAPAIAATFAACVAAPGPRAAPAATAAPPAGSLFSTIPCGISPIAREWGKLRAEAAARYPHLRLTMVEDLHVTVVYVGPGWKAEDLDRIRALALVAPREAATFRPEVVRLGRNAQAVAVELHGAPESWSAAVGAAKAEMNRLGLRKPDAYDGTVRPHVTLASARNNPPDAAEAAALDELRVWIAEVAAAEPERWTLAIGPRTPLRLWLAGTVRPVGAPEFVDVEETSAYR